MISDQGLGAAETTTMGANFAHGITVLLMATSLFGVSMANKDWYFGFNYTDWWSRFGRHPPNKPSPSKTINVGGSENWHFGFNYTDWSIKNHPFYLNDTLGKIIPFLFHFLLIDKVVLDM